MSNMWSEWSDWVQVSDWTHLPLPEFISSVQDQTGGPHLQYPETETSSLTFKSFNFSVFTPGLESNQSVPCCATVERYIIMA